MQTDSLDRRILAVLQRRGRISNADLSEEVNLSPSACHRRVQRLEAEGYIDAYVALLNARKLDRPTTVFVEITLSGQADEVLEAFEREVRRVPDVLECHLMAGTADYLLKVVAQDTEDFILDLVRCHKNMSIVLVKGTHPEKARKAAAELVAVHETDRGCADGKVFVGVGPDSV